jgi:hypothetical protein
MADAAGLAAGKGADGRGDERGLAGDGIEPGRFSGADRVECGGRNTGDLLLDLGCGAHVCARALCGGDWVSFTAIRVALAPKVPGRDGLLATGPGARLAGGRRVCNAGAVAGLDLLDLRQPIAIRP